MTNLRRYRCHRCNLELIAGTQPHRDANDCIKALSSRLQIAATKATEARREAQCQRNHNAALKTRTVDGLTERMAAIERSHAEFRQKFLEVNSKLTLVMGELHGHDQPMLSIDRERFSLAQRRETTNDTRN